MAKKTVEKAIKKASSKPKIVQSLKPPKKVVTKSESSRILSSKSNAKEIMGKSTEAPKSEGLDSKGPVRGSSKAKKSTISVKSSKALGTKGEAVNGEEIEPQNVKVIPAVSDKMPSKKAKKNDGATEEETKWLELRTKYGHIKPKNYRMSEDFQEKTPIDHKTLGWGFILSNINDRLEVLFRSGMKQLISNYKAQG